MQGHATDRNVSLLVALLGTVGHNAAARLDRPATAGGHVEYAGDAAPEPRPAGEDPLRRVHAIAPRQASTPR
jgi:hypothetical protein